MLFFFPKSKRDVRTSVARGVPFLVADTSARIISAEQFGRQEERTRKPTTQFDVDFRYR